ncbi:MAG: histone deacetylase family protein, partial [Pseudomonadota bacterium]
MTTLLFTHSACFDHDPGRMHPECPARLKSVLNALEAEEFAALDRREAPRASDEQIRAVHPQSHLDSVAAAIPESGYAQIDADTIASAGSHEAAYRAAGAVCAAVDAVMAGEGHNAFCAVRPPGHHAEPHRAMGFCLFNNIAVAARHAQRRYGLERVAVIDFDVHHGNGTQAMFEDDHTLFYGSTHQEHIYPGTGLRSETGVDNIVNAPLPAMAGGAEFRHAMTETVLPALFDFRPDFLMISAGFDAHADDPLAAMNLQDEDYEWATQELMRVADQSCDGRIVSALEGGYDLHALGRSTAAHVR